MSAVFVGTNRDGRGELQITLHFSESSLITPELARVALQEAVDKLSDEIVKQYKDEVLARVDFTQIAHLVLAKSAERIADKISRAVQE